MAEPIHVGTSNRIFKSSGLPLVIVWGLAVVAGMAGAYRYQMAPAAVAQAVPDYWPGNCGLTPDGQRPIMVLMLHPRCPCSAATLHELNEVMSRAADLVDVRIVFSLPQGAPTDWPGGTLWNQAAAIPGAKLLIDQGGVIAKAFGATNSGQVVLYDRGGALLFKGGITDGRGHEGDNPGMLAVLAILRHSKPAITTTSVYGCSLGICSTSADRSEPR